MQRSCVGIHVIWIALFGGDRQEPPPRIQLRLAEVQFRVGSGTTTPTEPFGSIESARFVSETVIVLDGRRPGLFHFSSRGRQIEVVGRSGSGPGEMHEPTVLQVAPGGRAILLDRALLRLTHYEYSGGKFRLVSTTRLEDDGTESFCLLRGQLIAYGYNASTGRILHVLKDGTRSSSWGDTLFAGGPRINSIATGGAVLCLEREGMVVIAPHLKGEIIAYSESGALKWRTTLTDFVGPVVQAVARGGVLFGRQPGSKVAHGTIGVHRLNDEFLLVQTGVRSDEHRGRDFDYERVDSRILRIVDGVEISRVTDLPVILDVSLGRVLVAGGEPDLWLEMRSYKLVRTGR